MKITIVLLIVWIALSFYIRMVGLEKSPLSVGFDEASLGYNAYSLLETGKDEYGNEWPLSLRSFNDFKPALYAYLSIPFIHFLDLNQTSTRAPSAVFGTLSLVFLLLIFKKLSKTSWLVSLLVLATISFFPWRLHFSRVAFESNISMAFFTGAIWCLLNFSKHTVFKIGVIIFSTLSIYSYHGARLAIPILLLLCLTDPLSLKFRDIAKNPIKIARKLWPIAIVAILYIPMLLDTEAGLLLTRLNQTNVISHFYPFTPKELIFAPPWLNIIAHPLYYLGGILTGHVFSYLSPQNLSLLIYPGVIKSAQVISGTGMLGFLGGALFIIGFLSSIKSIFLDKEKRILVYSFLAGIIPAAITWEWFYPLRSLNIYPALDCISGFGLLWVLYKLVALKRVVFRLVSIIFVILVILMSSVYNLMNEWNYGAWETNGEFQPGGYKEGVPLLLSLKDNYKTIYIDSNHAQNYTIFWFYMKYPPENIQKIAELRNKPGIEGPPTINFDNFVYKKFHWPTIKEEGSFVFWTSSEVKDEEINSTPGAKLYRIQGPLGNWPVSIITKE